MKWYYSLFALQTIGATALAAWLFLHWEAILGSWNNKGGRQMVRVLLLSMVFYTAFMPGNLGWTNMPDFYARPLFAAAAYVYVGAITLLAYLAHAFLTRTAWYRHHPQAQPVVSFLFIALAPFLLDSLGQQWIGYRGDPYINNISYSLLIGCCAGLLHLFFRFYTRNTELRIARLQQMKTAAELEVLQAKINPHFLYNALSGLAGLALEDGRKASRMATGLSHLFRYSLNKEQQPLALVSEELEMTQTYLNIEQIRFEAALQVQISVADVARSLRLPRFLLQPLVENCIKHAFHHMTEAGRIELLISGTNPLTIEVRDNGQPFPPTLSQGYGLESIRNKLSLLFPGQHQIEFQNQPYKAAIITIWQQPATAASVLL